jgi:predicted ester cyclase
MEVHMNRDTIESRARRFVLEHNQAGFRRALDELVAPGFIVHEFLPGVPESMDRVAFEGFVSSFRAAMPDIRDEVVAVLVDGARAAVRWRGAGTHTGEALMGIPAKGGSVRANGIYLLAFDGDRIAEVWSNWDNLSVLEQLK